MLQRLKPSSVVPRIIIVVACCAGIWNSINLARADYYFRKDNDQSIRAAISLVPDGWQFYLRLAQFDRANAKQLLGISLRLNPYNAQADIELGLQFEADGDFSSAEKQLLNAFNVDHTYLPRWSLANYYFRRGNMPRFWEWARSAAEMPADDIGALLQLCWRASPDPTFNVSALANNDPKMLHQFIRFLSDKGQSGAVFVVAPSLIRFGDSNADRALMLEVINKLVAVNDAAEAVGVWHMLIEKHWVDADLTTPNNARFLREPLLVSFDWFLPEYNGMHSWPGTSGLQVEFSGSEPEECLVAEQVVALAPGNYSFDFSYRTSNIPAGTGVRWQISEARSDIVLRESEDISSEELKNAGFRFTVPADAPLQRVRLLYRRTLGTPRIAGTINIHSTRIRALPNN